MQITPLEVNDAFSRIVLDIGVTDVPFLRDRPVEHRGAAPDLVYFQRHCLLKQAQTLANTIACDASANWIKGLYDSIGLPALHSRINLA
jgi:hypothetical protein